MRKSKKKIEQEQKVFAVAMLKLASFFKKRRDEKPRIRKGNLPIGEYRIILAQRGNKVVIGYSYEGLMIKWTREYDSLIEAIYEGLPTGENND